MFDEMDARIQLRLNRKSGMRRGLWHALRENARLRRENARLRRFFCINEATYEYENTAANGGK